MQRYELFLNSQIFRTRTHIRCARARVSMHTFLHSTMTAKVIAVNTLVKDFFPKMDGNLQVFGFINFWAPSLTSALT